MGRKRIIWLTVAFFVALLVVAVCILWEPSGPPEPMYQGKQLSYWLRMQYVPEISTDAIPVLVRSLRAKDSRFKLNFARVVEKVPWVHYRYWPATHQNGAAVLGFAALGSRAKGAVPELMEIYDRQISEESQEATAMALAYIGHDAETAVPTLLHGTSNAPTRVRVASIYALGAIRTSPNLAVPVLINSLGDANIYVRAAAANALEKFDIFGEPVKRAVPALVKALGDTNETVNASAEKALKTIDPAALKKAREEGKVRSR